MNAAALIFHAEDVSLEYTMFGQPLVSDLPQKPLMDEVYLWDGKCGCTKVATYLVRLCVGVRTQCYTMLSCMHPF